MEGNCTNMPLNTYFNLSSTVSFQLSVTDHAVKIWFQQFISDQFEWYFCTCSWMSPWLLLLLVLASFWTDSELSASPVSNIWTQTFLDTDTFAHVTVALPQVIFHSLIGGRSTCALLEKWDQAIDSTPGRLTLSV